MGDDPLMLANFARGTAPSYYSITKAKRPAAVVAFQAFVVWCGRMLIERPRAVFLRDLGHNVIEKQSTLSFPRAWLVRSRHIEFATLADMHTFRMPFAHLLTKPDPDDEERRFTCVHGAHRAHAPI